MEIDIPDNLGAISFWAGKWASTPVSVTDIGHWQTYAVTRGDDVDDSVSVYIDGVLKHRATGADPRVYSQEPFWIGGFRVTPGTTDTEWASFLGTLEYFAMWKRKLTDAEIAEFTDKPYSVVKHQLSVDKPLKYQAINGTKEFGRDLAYYTSSWVDDIVNHRPIYPESYITENMASIDPDTQNLIFDSNFIHTQMVDFAGNDRLSNDEFTVSLRFKLHANARSQTLNCGLWSFWGGTDKQRVQASLRSNVDSGYTITFTIGAYTVTAAVTWNLLSVFKTWSFTYDADNRITIYRNDTLMASKDIVGRRVRTSGGLRVGYNYLPIERALPGEVEYVSVWNRAFNSVKLHDFLELPYDHLKDGILQNIKPAGKGVVDTTQTITNWLTTYVFDAKNEVIRNRELSIWGDSDADSNTYFIGGQTVFDIQTSKQTGFNRYETRSSIHGYRPSSAPAEPNVDNRTFTFRAKLLPKPPGSPSDVIPHQSTLFCCANSSNPTTSQHQTCHVYYYGNGESDPQIVFEYGNMYLKYPYSLTKALQFHDFAFRIEQEGGNRTLTIWIDGEKVDTKTNANTFRVDDLQFRLGGYWDLRGGSYTPYIRFKGVVDSYGIWGRALNAAEIKKLNREPYVCVNPNDDAKPNPDEMNLVIKPGDLTRDLYYYTLDFKKELVHQYDMESTGNEITWKGAPTHNVEFTNASNHNCIYLCSSSEATRHPISTENLTIIYKVKKTAIRAPGGNYYCVPDWNGNDRRLSSHCMWMSGGKFRWVTDTGRFANSRVDVSFGDTVTGEPLWPTVAFRMTKQTDGKYRYEVFVNGNKTGTSKVLTQSREGMTNNPRLAIGGWKTSNNYKGGQFEMEYFAFWNRALRDPEIFYVTKNPYIFITGTPKSIPIAHPEIHIVDPRDEDAD